LRVGYQETPPYELSFQGGDETGERFSQVSLPDKAARTLTFLCRAADIAKIFLGPPKSWILFRENPRGPLQRYNRQILSSLKDPKKKSRFHTLNNGLSIVCNKYTLTEDKKGVKIEGMRIVNGCQTTVTLAKAVEDKLLDDTVLIFVRLTETTDTNYRKQIAEANNTQRAVRSVDLASLQDELRHYHQLFENLRPNPYFLEVQAGDWEYMTSRDDKRRFEQPYIEREALAQAVLAFQNKPSEAMEERRYIFQRKTGPEGDPRGHFEDVFGRGLIAEQLLLPWLVMKKVGLKIEEAENERREMEAQGKEITPLHHPENVRYSRLHRTWLVGQILGLVFNVDFSSSDLDRSDAKKLCKKIDDYFDALYEVVDETIYEAMELISGRMGDEFEARKVFRLSHSTFMPTAAPRPFVPRSIFQERLRIILGRQNRLRQIKELLQSAAVASE